MVEDLLVLPQLHVHQPQVLLEAVLHHPQEVAVRLHRALGVLEPRDGARDLAHVLLLAVGGELGVDPVEPRGVRQAVGGLVVMKLSITSEINDWSLSCSPHFNKWVRLVNASLLTKHTAVCTSLFTFVK